MAASTSEMIVKNYKEFLYADEFRLIIDMLSDQVKVDNYLDELSQKVLNQVAVINAKIKTASGVLQNITDEEQIKGIALHDVLRVAEKKHEFHDEVWYLEGVLSASEFFKLMNEGRAFMDPLVNTKHGAQTHRIQWWMVCQEIDSLKIGQPGLKASSLYKETANKTAQVEINPSNATTLWYKVFDNRQGGSDLGKNTARCPEWLMTHITTTEKYSNTLKPAEISAQKWSTAPRADSAFLWSASAVTMALKAPIIVKKAS